MLKDWLGEVEGPVRSAAFRERSPNRHSVLPVESAVLNGWLDVQQNVLFTEQSGAGWPCYRSPDNASTSGALLGVSIVFTDPANQPCRCVGCDKVLH